MFPLLETIRMRDGRMMNLSYHEDRINRSLILLYGKRELPPLNTLIKINSELNSGIYKCSMLYSNTDFTFTLKPYLKRNIDSLLLLECPDITYELKYSDRSIFNNLLPDNKANTEIIITHQGFLTDTRYTNIALKNDRQWITPQSPLLEGTQRAYLVENRIIETGNISSEYLHEFSKIRLFNAMMPWEDCIELDVSKIKNYD